MKTRVLITGTGAICAAGAQPEAIWRAVCSGRSALAPVRQWNGAREPDLVAGEIADLDPRALVADRKVHKLLRRTDLLGLYAAGRAIDAAGLIAHRATLGAEGVAVFDDGTGVYVGSGGGAFQDQYDFFPLLSAAEDDLAAFGRELTATVNPLWLLRTLPNNVLCHVGIQYGFKGPNGCVTDHGVSGLQAIAEGSAVLRAGDAERAIAIAHDAPVEPQTVLGYQGLGLLATDAVRPFDAGRTGSLLGEGAAALTLETESAARSRAAAHLGEILGSGSAAEAEGVLGIRSDGDGPARAIGLALEDAGLRATEVGMIVAHGNGTRASDASEAAAISKVFGDTPPPVTAFKWAFGHLLAASGAMETVLALWALRQGVVPGIPTLRRLDPQCARLPVSAAPQRPRSNVALVLSRGFAGTNAALLVRAADRDERR